MKFYSLETRIERIKNSLFIIVKTKEKNSTLFALVLAFFHFEFVFKDTSPTTQHPYMIRHTFVIRKILYRNTQ